MNEELLKNNIGIVGFNSDSANLANFLASHQFNVFIFKSKANLETLKFEDSKEDFPLVYSLRIRTVTNQLEFVCENCSTLIVTYPSNVFRIFAKELEKHIVKGTRVIVLNEDQNKDLKCLEDNGNYIEFIKLETIMNSKEFNI